ncbi:MAG: HAD-IA family hydrolase [Spirochaetaceae bacterium]|jgi:putative hydrolase of the HAD superfamily|nr:HAD-IA family hydrolase [Spirochaetaceae bacterium]
MIKAVIFDYGNVISLPQSLEPAREMERISGIPARVFESVYDKFRHGFDRGDYTGAQMYAMLMRDAGRDDLADNRALMEKFAYIDMESWQYMDEAAADWALSLQDGGFKLGILSNIPTEFIDKYGAAIPPFVRADYACFSCREKLIKPERAIFERVLSALEVAPEEAVFFDDLQENIDGARNAGIHGILWTSLEQAKADLQALLASVSPLGPGIQAHPTPTVDETNTASARGSGLLPVFATPAMIGLMEHTAACAAAPYLEAGYSTVGTEVRVRHLGATPIGMTVRATAELIEVDRRRLLFTVEAFDEAAKIGEGTHERFIVDNGKFLGNLARNKKL